MNAEQKKMLQMVFVIFCCFGIYTYTVATAQVYHYCDWTGLLIEDRFGNEVTFTFRNGTRAYYCCINISLLAFELLKSTGNIDQLENVDIRCAMCGMLMDWDDPMIVWIYSTDYLCPTTGDPTIVGVCEDVGDTELCESHFLNSYGGEIIENPYIWPS